MNRIMKTEHEIAHLLKGIVKGYGVTHVRESEHDEPRDDVVARIEIIRDGDGYVTQTIKRNAAGDVIETIDADDDLIAGTGMR
ncbi:hypothetical protein HW130_18515 [Streptomyces sp. PKU-EA00015]|uniref:hypothetical protein n=1 Tax=Streptomyces sp. PKU-EA00015 TaxID=2748326 RepID=UPI0015A3A534|nr:hypothetical protein [Streptomyces sp. PKU-EA00015]NWF28237.1 hypothetical protein [Streptomyces sp. PKU-EA00015]